MSKIYAGYLRVSDERQRDNYSIASQRRVIEQYVTDLGGTVSLWYIDEAKSGRNVEGRDAFLEMRRDAAQGRFNVLVVHRWDRLNRNRMQSTAVKALLRKDYGIQILSATEPSEDADGSMGGLIEGILESVSEWYSRNLSEKYVLGRQEMWLQGKYVGSKRAFGYEIGEDRVLVPHASEGPVVKRLYELYSTGEWSVQRLADWLNEQGYVTINGRAFNVHGVKEILKNPLYKGYLKRQVSTFDARGKRTYDAPVEYRRGAHQALVDEDLWEKVARIRASRTKNKIGGNMNDRYLLQEMVYCADCMDEAEAREAAGEDVDSPAYGRCKVIWGGTKRSDGTYPRFYRCRARNVPLDNRRYRLTHKGADMDAVHGTVLAFLMSLRHHKNWREQGIDVLASVLQEKTVEARLSEVQDRARRLDHRFDKGYIVDMDEYERERAALQAEIDALEPLVDDSVARARDILDNFVDHWAKAAGDLNAQRDLLKLLVERVYIKEGEVSAVVIRPGQWFVLTD